MQKGDVLGEQVLGSPWLHPGRRSPLPPPPPLHARLTHPLPPLLSRGSCQSRTPSAPHQSVVHMPPRDNARFHQKVVQDWSRVNIFDLWQSEVFCGVSDACWFSTSLETQVNLHCIYERASFELIFCSINNKFHFCNSLKGSSIFSITAQIFNYFSR